VSSVLGRLHYPLRAKHTLSLFFLVAFAPGHTATALNGFKGRQTVETAAKYLYDVIMDQKGPSGVLIQREEVIGW
jgi:hypothetical protein